MIITFDIGNTNIKVALFDKEKLMHQWRISSDINKTEDEYFSLIRSLLRDENLDIKSINKSVISSVVPVLIHPLQAVCKKLTGKNALVIGPDIYARLPLKVPESAIHEIGTDLYCNAFSAWEKYKSPCIVCDFGTALSFIVVDKNGNIAGVAIAPGIRTAFKSLFANTAQLPAVPLEIPSTSLGKNTVVSIQAGIVLGYKGLVESLIKQMKIDLEKETGTNPADVKVIATGGLNSTLSPITNFFDFVDENLTLEGLRIIGERL